MILGCTPDLKATIPGFEDGVQVGIGGDVEFARQVKHGFHALMFRLMGHEIAPWIGI